MSNKCLCKKVTAPLQSTTNQLHIRNTVLPVNAFLRAQNIFPWLSLHVAFSGYEHCLDVLLLSVNEQMDNVAVFYQDREYCEEKRYSPTHSLLGHHVFRGSVKVQKSRYNLFFQADEQQQFFFTPLVKVSFTELWPWLVQTKDCWSS